MIFNKWKKRAYAEREKNRVLEEDLINCKKEIEELFKIFKIMDNNPTCKHILDLRQEAAIDGKPATRVYLTHEQQIDIYKEVGSYLGGLGGIQTIYGLDVVTTQKNMRVEE
jgi:hypothetical protein|tara:strand:+ start:5661 stop:5993 length:333 start_codon:yes stop_codon:yes gene_type:complete